MNDVMFYQFPFSRKKIMQFSLSSRNTNHISFKSRKKKPCPHCDGTGKAKDTWFPSPRKTPDPMTPNPWVKPIIPTYPEPWIPAIPNTPKIPDNQNDWWRRLGWGGKGSEQQECLHQQCGDCNGTGRKHNGQMCIHMISCPCPRCTFTC